MPYHKDTIAAIATAPGKGGVGIIRISGPLAYPISQKILLKNIIARTANYLKFYDKNNSVLDEGIAIYFKRPNSFTGEDVLELQGHGGPIILDMLLKEVISIGARLAKPGEFSERAFLNDKIDLAQAEAIADIIDASSEQAARCAVRSLEGDFSKKIYNMLEKLIQLRVHVEASIDFPEEEIDFLADNAIANQLFHLISELKKVMVTTKQGTLLREGITLVIAGKPNAGKSSLLNALAGKDSAIVTDIAGTTRDTLKEHIQIEGVPLHIIDTAGLRNSDDVIENEGVKRALTAIKNADHILLVSDITDSEADKETLKSDFFHNIPQNIAITHLHNKIDLIATNFENSNDNIYISAKKGIGINELKNHILQSVGFNRSNEGLFTARTRHINALNATMKKLEIAKRHLKDKNGELLAEELRLAQKDLGEITGEFGADDLLGRIFSSFCIGK